MTIIRRNAIRARVSSRELELGRLMGRRLRYETDKTIYFDHGRWRRRCTPDFLFPKDRVAVFYDGCYWHECPEHHLNRRGGIARAKWERDNQLMAERGWVVLRMWEHEPDLRAFADHVIATVRRLRADARPGLVSEPFQDPA